MTDGLKFLHEFFTQKKWEMNNITITLDERPCFDIHSEDYRFRVNIAEVIDEIDIFYRDVAIEDHHNQTKHQSPHLQFKLHADGIGHIHIFLPVTNAKEYKEYILSFLDLIGEVLIKMDNKERKIQTEFMISESFQKIKGKGNNIRKLVSKQYQIGELTVLTLGKEERKITGEDINKIKKITQISPFFDDVKI